ncbi:MAG: 3-ketoacyl-ACP reductase [Candidatus Aminicenantes bacterium]|nr:3-ketoacyl-ACP reductase [Candidatus Aminicenantes bacterium]
MKKRPVAIVTGAGRGIGRGIVISLAENGFDIAGNDIIWEPDNEQTGLFEVKRRVEELSVNFLPVKGDVSSLSDHDSLIIKTVESFGRIDVLVNNAGIAPLIRMDMLQATPESYDRLMAVNTRGPFFLTQKVAAHMIEQKKKENKIPDISPSIIFISSISAYVSSPSRAEYCISKAALSQAARLYADRLSEYGINVYEVRPGIIQTDMTASVKEKYDKKIAGGLIPQGRWGKPEDVGRAVAALARGDFAYSTGMIIEISGGMNISRL